ncbi:glutamate ABC transporter substrate-binding protein [Streptomyces sp. H10-C2]|uniref:glutamate ABC transporter substrate-binding protein n=1 Tax=unclassified Streptomyces TaxID=2593676 RepID=UPI0024BB153A|nr:MULTISPECIES: glutamate ABC transporter substrate-binding protein [unclassified Streptomyces]MDJ0340083.1 glutamate ABC transporter substrate-binding protein [Streptomyces sp. PH10-H1]MDJ0369280.1 glutamate ABC transporter substrate-binding protein [Streptomyces sp. H10-C2]
MSEDTRWTRGGWRGWGGVAGMAAACALVVSAVALPLRDGGTTADGRAYAPGAVTAKYASTEDNCDHPEASGQRPSSVDGAAVQRIKEHGKLIVGVDQNSYLWGFRDPATGSIVGFDIDLVRAIAKDILGDPDKVQFLTVPTDQRIPMIKAGKVDMVVRTMTINCSRLKDVAFSTAYFEAGQQLLVPIEGTSVTGFNTTLQGRTVCTAKGSTGEAKLKESSQGAKVVLVPNQLDCLVRLQLNLVDAVFTDNALAAGQAAQDPSVHLVGERVTTEPYGVAMNLADTDLVARVNKVLENYRSGGANSPWMQSFRHWLAAKLPDVTGPPAPLYKN